MLPARPTPNDTNARAALFHREIFQLGALILVAVAAFLLTRSVAASNRDMTLRDAAEWYRRGQAQIDTRQLDSAIDSFRRATVRDRAEKRYTLALAHALVLKQDYEAAQAQLLTLRDAAPEDPDINLQLARLAAERQDVTGSLRFYRSAVYALWPPEQADARRRLRFELIRFLLAHNQTSRAQGELLALTVDLPDDAVLHVQVGRLFAEASDNAHALDQFQRALLRAPENAEAVTGAGLAAFQLGNYQLARVFLRRATTESSQVQATRELVDLVLSSDPFAARIGSAERRRRFVADFSYAQQRLIDCVVPRPDADAAAAQDAALQDEVRAFADRVKSMRALEQDTVETGFDLIGRVEKNVRARCAPATALDQALVLIERQHGVDAH